MGQGEPAHEPTREEADPSGGQEAYLSDNDPFGLGFGEVMELLELELREVLGPYFEGDLIVEDAIDPGNQGSAEAEDDHPEELTQGHPG